MPSARPCSALLRMLAGTLATLLLLGLGSLRANSRVTLSPGHLVTLSQGPKFVLAWGKKGDKPGEFYSPISIAIDRRDVVYVTDLNNARLQRFTTDGEVSGRVRSPPGQAPSEVLHRRRHGRG